MAAPKSSSSSSSSRASSLQQLSAANDIYKLSNHSTRNTFVAIATDKALKRAKKKGIDLKKTKSFSYTAAEMGRVEASARIWIEQEAKKLAKK